MRRHYILVEGINLYANIYDTDQLSVIRGSSLLYKAAIKKIKTKFSDQLTAVSTGASSGLFYVTSPEDDAPADVVSDIFSTLNEHLQYRHLTFAVESCAADDVLTAREHLRRQLRFSQLSSIMQAPDFFEEGHARINHADELEGTRIAAHGLDFKIQASEKQKSRRLSCSTYQRWSHGRMSKQNHADYSFAPDIQTLCQLFENKEHASLYPAINSLNNKMAVFYADGNKFSDRERNYISSAMQPDSKDEDKDGVAALERFDNRIRCERRKFLTKTQDWLIELDEAIGTVRLTEDQRTLHLKTPEGDKKITLQEMALRMESLLWGGDEMTLVLPAWLGMAFVQRFFEHEWTLADGGEPLTHAAGIVFCQSKTPIRNVEKLARALADRVKEQPGGRKRNGWDYMVMESMDFPDDTEIDTFLQDRYSRKVSIADRPDSSLAPADWKTVNERLLKLLDEHVLPKRQLYQIIDVLKPEMLTDLKPNPKQKVNTSEDAESRAQETVRPLMTLERMLAIAEGAVQRTEEEIAAEKREEQRRTYFAAPANQSDAEPSLPEVKPPLWYPSNDDLTDVDKLYNMTNPQLKALRQRQLPAQEQAELRLLDVIGRENREKLLHREHGLPTIAKKLFGIDDINDRTKRAWLWIHLAELWDYCLPLKALAKMDEEARGGAA